VLGAVLRLNLITGTGLKTWLTGIKEQKNLIAWCFSVLFVFISGASLAQSNAQYLKIIESEASGVRVDKETAQSGSARADTPTRLFKNEFENNLGGARIDLTAGLTIEQFEHVLKNNYIGSYLFYKRLSDAKKQKIYQFYQNNPDPAQVRKKILQVSKQ